MISVAIALGQFDGVHIGHKSVIDACVSFAKKNNIKSVALTFYKNVLSTLSGEDGLKSSVFSLEERIDILKKMGIDEVFVVGKDRSFFDKTKGEFLDFLNQEYDIKAYFFGEDFTFGKNGEGNYLDVISYSKEKAQEVFVMPILKIDGKKVSASEIKNLLTLGEIERANSLLFSGYYVKGKVIKQRGVGKTIGFPTLNVIPDESKIPLKNAVYGGRVIIDGQSYKAVINYGNRPTFNVEEKVIEAHAIGFNKEVYGKVIEIYFDKYIREIQKFSSKEELIYRLKSDVESVK